MKITSIQQQKKDPVRVNIFIDDKFAFGLDSKFLVDFNLYKDKEITKEEIDEIVFKDTGEKLKNKVLNLISKRPHSKKEVRDYIMQKLKEKKFDVEESLWICLMENVISDLEKYDLINDENFAKWFVQNRKDFKPRGKALLKQELKQKGVSNNIIAQCLNYENDEELEFVKALAEKKLKTLSRFDKQKQNEKIASFLQRKGFSYELIKKVVNFERDY